MVDSLAGAKWEIKGKINNETTNLIATGISAVLGLLAWFLVF